MAVAVGYEIERGLWEFVFGLLFVYSSAEIYLALSGGLSRIKRLQRTLLSCAFITSVIGVCGGMDVRGAFGIFASVPTAVRIFWNMSILVPPVVFVFMFGMNLYATALKYQNDAPDISESQELKIVAAFIFSWLAMLFMVAVWVSLTNRIIYNAVLWGWGALCGLLFTLVAWKSYSTMKATFSDGSLAVSSSSDFSSRQNKLVIEREAVLLRLLITIMVSLLATLACLGELAYHVFGSIKDKTASDSLNSDPNNFNASFGVLSLGGLMSGICFVGLMSFGRLCRCRFLAKETVRSKASKLSEL